MQDSPLAPSPAHQDERAAIARLGLLFVCAVSPRSVEFAARKLKELFGHDADPAEIRAAQQQLLVEASTGITSLLRKGRR